MTVKLTTYAEINSKQVCLICGIWIKIVPSRQLNRCDTTEKWKAADSLVILNVDDDARQSYKEKWPVARRRYVHYDLGLKWLDVPP